MNERPCVHFIIRLLAFPKVLMEACGWLIFKQQLRLFDYLFSPCADAVVFPSRFLASTLFVVTGKKMSIDAVPLLTLTV